MSFTALSPLRERAASVADDTPLESVLFASQTTHRSHYVGRKHTQRCKSPEDSKAHQAKVDSATQESEHWYMWIIGPSAVQIPR